MDVKAKLFGAGSRKKFGSVTVEILGEPVTVFFRTPSGRERDNFEESILVEKKRLVNGKLKSKREVTHDNIRAKLVALCACKGTSDPSPLFTQEEVEQLGQVNADILDKLFDKASEMAGLNKDDVDELVGN